MTGLFDPGQPGKARRDHTRTSKIAAESVAEVTGEGRRKVLLALASAPMTDEEIGEFTGLSNNTHRARRIELVAAGLVEDSGCVRPTRSGRVATIWSLTFDGRQAAESLREGGEA